MNGHFFKRCNSMSRCALLICWYCTAVTYGEQWDILLNSGLTLNDGNSESLRVNAGVLLEGEKERLGAVQAGLEGNYGQSRITQKGDDPRSVREKDVENYRAFLNLNQPVSERTFWTFSASGLYDSQALIDYRIVLGPGVGTVLYKGRGLKLSVEVGPSYLFEKVDGQTTDFPVIRFAERLEWRITEQARLWQETEFLPKADDFSEYLLLSELGISAAINSRVSLRTVLQSQYDPKPAQDREKHDLALVAALSVKLGSAHTAE